MTRTPRASVPFYKMQGCGNDFVFIDNRELKLPVALMEDWARKICRRSFSVGADGLVFLEEAPDIPGVDYRWHFYNADGSRAEMCGNASRCAALLAFRTGFAGAEHVLGTDAGPVRARVDVAAGMVKVELTPPKELSLNNVLRFGDETHEIHFVNTGVPHAVWLDADAAALDVRALGASLRYHERFAPAGTNANFVTVIDQHNILLRTYERGVEDETYACGTGAAAGAVITHALGLTGPQVTVRSSGGELLGISLEDGSVFLEGKALLVYTGEMQPESLGISLD
ncbi:diaminopimelate epimerase [Oleidesulfovibrio alaskensis G20]|jgi:diaminopimelate epimerase|uniref:Diaminopimelate epimerase n=1 Tax=Oleidesulfovibrio alaskensis (strain ATCC BAA-1058 / DSM 17464 / G20) TaxID=207559 RepID=Q310Q1_OLEA2|nr:diaminopimelate epimerase [Oleidesulfovibrio alaskensis]ABB38595.1 diaminopimelate epimerase [Oleidesulfovibrio alaskensis G20]MBG0773919.1 diaminopimelate epimerase [Oleidesulfovibrio alaskensis]MBL3581611.1 diaminopimelate epimerase [Oleidesulfovibrio alaskensis]MBL3588090.1 diaminopimelate epimerase [bacterium]